MQCSHLFSPVGGDLWRLFLLWFELSSLRKQPATGCAAAGAGVAIAVRPWRTFGKLSVQQPLDVPHLSNLPRVEAQCPQKVWPHGTTQCGSSLSFAGSRFGIQKEIHSHMPWRASKQTTHFSVSLTPNNFTWGSLLECTSLGFPGLLLRSARRKWRCRGTWGTSPFLQGRQSLLMLTPRPYTTVCWVPDWHLLL